MYKGYSKTIEGFKSRFIPRYGGVFNLSFNSYSPANRKITLTCKSCGDVNDRNPKLLALKETICACKKCDNGGYRKQYASRLPHHVSEQEFLKAYKWSKYYLSGYISLSSRDDVWQFKCSVCKNAFSVPSYTAMYEGFSCKCNTCKDSLSKLNSTYRDLSFKSTDVGEVSMTCNKGHTLNIILTSRDFKGKRFCSTCHTEKVSQRIHNRLIARFPKHKLDKIYYKTLADSKFKKTCIYCGLMQRVDAQALLKKDRYLKCRHCDYKDIRDRSFYSRLKSNYLRKTIELKGKVFPFQGYEDRALNYLVSLGISVDDIIVGKQVPRVSYEYGKEGHRYYPDIFLPKHNMIIEVKSTWTAGVTDIQTFANLRAKANYTKKEGYIFVVMVFTADAGPFIIKDFESLTFANFRARFKKKFNKLPSLFIKKRLKF